MKALIGSLAALGLIASPALATSKTSTTAPTAQAKAKTHMASSHAKKPARITTKKPV